MVDASVPVVTAPVAQPPVAAVTSGAACPNCSRQWGGGAVCQFCNQVDGMAHGVCLSSVGKRFGAYLLDGLLVVVTLGIGWLIWGFLIFGRGQTPAKQILGMRIVSMKTGEPSWGLTFVREVIAKSIIWVLSILTAGIVNFWLVWDRNNQQLWDKVTNTIVIDAK